MVKKPAVEEPHYTREAILKDKRFAKYQQDFLGVLLKEPEYTIPEALRICQEYFGE